MSSCDLQLAHAYAYVCTFHQEEEFAKSFVFKFLVLLFPVSNYNTFRIVQSFHRNGR